ncbi:MAG: hypothetical protein J5685_09960, partial [Clostridiales bacterium]|nr:hypothetical protein [Clostridiales bacterium]
KIGQGKDNTRQFLIDNPEISSEIEELIRDSYKPADEEDIPSDDPALTGKGNADELDPDDDDILGIDDL